MKTFLTIAILAACLLSASPRPSHPKSISECARIFKSQTHHDIPDCTAYFPQPCEYNYTTKSCECGGR